VESAICQIARESNDFEFRCEDGAKLRVTFALDCCDREAISWVASPHGYSGDDVRDVMLEAIEQRFGSELPASPVQWLSDNGSAYTAEQTRAFAPPIGLLHFKVCYGINGVFTHSGAPQGKDKRPFKFLHTSVPTEYDQPKPKYRPVLIG